MKKDDSSLRPEELENVRKHARLLLNKADAFGVFPTPVDRLVSTAKLEVNEEVSLGKEDEGFLAKLNKKLGKAARPHLYGVKKLLGLLHVPSGEILLDHSQHKNKIKFIKLHETGHGFMPHQKDMYEFMEDGMLELDPEIEDQFEREANNFASESLFQLDKYEKMAADFLISINAPIDLSKKFGSSVYSSMRRYVQTHFAALALGVYDPPSESEKTSFSLRREPIYSQDFLKKFGPVVFPKICSVDEHLGAILKPARLQKHHLCGLKDRNGAIHECAIHIFSNSYEKFVMLIPLKKSSALQDFYFN